MSKRITDEEINKRITELKNGKPLTEIGCDITIMGIYIYEELLARRHMVDDGVLEFLNQGDFKQIIKEVKKLRKLQNG